MKTFTKKQKAFIDEISRGSDKVDAVQKVYNTTSRASANVIANRLLENDMVSKELAQRQTLLSEKMVDKQSKFIDILRQIAPPQQVARKLAELIFSSDSRVSDSAIEKWLKLGNLYPDQKIGVYQDLEREREQILTEGDVKRIEEAKIVEDQEEQEDHETK